MEITLAEIEGAGFVPPDVAMFGKRYVKKWQNSVNNLGTYSYWRQALVTAALSRFKWEGLPNGIDARYIELMLLGYGAFAVTRRGAKSGGVLPFVAARMAPISNRDLYDNPNAISLVTPNGVQLKRHANWRVENGVVLPPDAAVCWNNLVRAPVLQVLDMQARRLAEMDMTADQHVRAQRVPYIIAVQEGGEKNAEALYNSIESGKPAIFYYRNNGFSELPVSVMQTMTAAGYAGDKIMNDALKIKSAALTFLGIDNNAAAEKKERVQTSETLANNEEVLIMRDSYMRTRQEFIDAAGELWEDWKNVKCTWCAPHFAEMGEVQDVQSELWGDAS